MSIRLPALLFTCVAASWASSAAAVEPMIGAELTWTHIEVADETFNPPAARLRLALALTPDWEIGVAGGTGIDSDDEVGVTAELSEFGEAYVRYSASLDDNARLVLSVGYGETTLDVQTALPGYPGAETYSGVVWGVSLQERLSRHPDWIGSLDYERWYDDDGLTISTLSYGFRYAF
ncbi:MAG: hypothetical protein ACOY3X_00565 [Pseudomonadota bacterium]